MSANTARPRGHPTHSFSTSETESHSRAYGLSPAAAASSSLAAPQPIAAPPVRPPPLYSLIATGLHRCSAIGLEESLNEAWASLQPQRDKRREASNGGAAKGGTNGNGNGSGSTKEEQRSYSSSASSSSSSARQQQGDERLAPPARKTRASPSPPGTPPRQNRPQFQSSNSQYTASPSKATPSTALTYSDLESSPSLSFLASLQLRTIVYLSPSLLPSALLKLSRELDLNFLQWDLTGGKIWNRRTGQGLGGRGGRVGEREREALDRFADLQDSRAAHADLEEKAYYQDEEEVKLGGLDHTRMCRATVELMLNKHCGNVLICDPSGLSEVSLVVGCLRRMMRWNFASVCLEYRAFAPTRSASTTSNLRFMELFPLESLELPDWPDLIEIAVDALKDVQVQHDKEEQGASTRDSK